MPHHLHEHIGWSDFWNITENSRWGPRREIWNKIGTLQRTVGGAHDVRFGTKLEHVNNPRRVIWNKFGTCEQSTTCDLEQIWNCTELNNRWGSRSVIWNKIVSLVLLHALLYPEQPSTRARHQNWNKSPRRLVHTLQRTTCTLYIHVYM